ncbi:polysaccharide pyruvyl transferase CsaB [Synechococcus sp.]
MVSTSKKLLICGYYGEHNLGDDALLQALLAELPAGCSVVVTAADEAQVRKRFGVQTCNRRSFVNTFKGLIRCNFLIFGGGSLLQDSTSFKSLLFYSALIIAARLQGKSILLWGQGLGPLRRWYSRLLVRLLLANVQSASWRDSDSAALAKELGRNPTPSDPVGADPVWGLARGHWRGKGGAIVLAWRPTPLLQAPQWRTLLWAVSLLAQQSERQVLWLPFHANQDRGMLLDLYQKGFMPEALWQCSRELNLERPEEAMAEASLSGLVIAMRLHALILAALTGAPCAALSYDPKVSAAAAGLSCQCLDLALLQNDPEQIKDIWINQLDKPLSSNQIESQINSSKKHHRGLALELGQINSKLFSKGT